MLFQYITELRVPEHFGYTEEDTIEYDAIVKELPPCVCDWGCTQFVLIPKAGNYVYKIPFGGKWEPYCDEDEEYYEGLDDVIIEDGYIWCPYDIDDYCAVGVDIYEDALEVGVEQFFAKIEFLGHTKNFTPIYRQEKIRDTYGSGNSDIKDIENTDSYKKLKQKRSDCPYSVWCNFPIDWVAAAIEYYGEDATYDFLNFADGLDDLHYENFGWRKDGSPVVFDYSGYHEDGESW